MADSPLIKRLRKQAERLGKQAVSELLQGDKASAINAAVRGVQAGRRGLDEGAGRVLSALGLAGKEDLEKVNRRIAKLRKRLTAILDDLQ